jgi:hypothetical protein
MIVNRMELTPFFCICDCESHGHRMTLSVLQKTREAKQTKPCAWVAKDIPKHERRAGRVPTCSQVLRDTSSPRFPENCPKPIKEDTVAFHAGLIQHGFIRNADFVGVKLDSVQALRIKP